MKVKVTIPDFLSIKHYRELTNIDHLTDFAKLIKTISIISDLEEEEVRKWDATSIATVYNDVIEALNMEEKYYPVFELNGTLYGFRNFKDLTLGEYIDLESLCKEPTLNLSEIMAVLYRPITKHKLNDWTFKTMHNVKLAIKSVDNPFKYYEIEEYDTKKRSINADELEAMPAQFALGALAFFLGLGNLFLQISLPYSKSQKKKMVKMIADNLTTLASIGDGLGQFIHSPNQVFSVSQETRVSLS